MLTIYCVWGENERRMRDDIVVSAVEMLEKCRLRDVEPWQEEQAPGLAIYKMGTLRSRDPKTLVLNGFNPCQGVPNLYVTDGAAMKSSACQKPH